MTLVRDLLEDLDEIMLNEDILTRLLKKIPENIKDKKEAKEYISRIMDVCDKLSEKINNDIKKEIFEKKIGKLVSVSIRDLKIKGKYLIVRHNSESKMGKQSIAIVEKITSGEILFKPALGEEIISYYEGKFCGCGGCRFKINIYSSTEKFYNIS